MLNVSNLKANTIDAIWALGALIESHEGDSDPDTIVGKRGRSVWRLCELMSALDDLSGVC